MRVSARSRSAATGRPGGGAPPGLYDAVVNGKTYLVRTFGCQMYVHDSERLSGLLEQAGYTAPPRAPTPTSWC